MKRVALGLVALLGIAWIGWQDIPGEFLQRDRNRITDFGGIPNDGKADDTAFAALQTALLAAGQYEAFLPKGTWNFDAQLALSPGVHLRGDSRSTTILLFEGLADEAISMEDNCSLRDLQLKGDGTVGSVGLGGVQSAARCSFYDITVTGFETNIFLRGHWFWDFYSCYVTAATADNIWAYPGTSSDANDAVTTLHFYGGEIGQADGYGVKVQNGTRAMSSLNFIATGIEGNALGGIYVPSGGSYTTGLNCTDAYFELNGTDGGTGFDIDIAGYVGGGTISGCVFHTSPNCIRIANGAYIVIDGNYFDPNGGKAIQVTNAAAINVDIRTNHFTTAGEKYNPATDNSGTRTKYLGRYFGTSAPAAGTWETGEIVDNLTPLTAGTPAYWVCTVAGTPGTWVAKYDPYFDTPMAFGANPAGTTDNETEIAACITARGYARIPAGHTYRVNGTIVIDDGQRIFGENWETSVLAAKTGFAGPVATLGSRASLMELTVDGATVTSSTGVKPASAETNWLIEHCVVKDFTSNILIDSAASNGRIRDCRLVTPITQNILISSTPTDTLVDGCYLDGGAGHGISLTGAAVGTRITNNRIGGAGASGVSSNAAIDSTLIMGNVLESNVTNDVGLASVSQTSTTIRANRMSSANGIAIAGADYTNIDANTFNCATKAIQITASGAVRTTIGTNDYISGAFVYETDNTGTATSYLGRIYDTAAPAAGTWEVGEIVWNRNPTTTNEGVDHWVCVSAGTPGTWRAAYRGFGHLSGTKTWDPDSLDNGQSDTESITVTGAAAGDFVVATHGQNLPNGFTITGQVIGADTVEVTISNVGGGTQDVASDTLSVRVIKQ